VANNTIGNNSGGTSSTGNKNSGNKTSGNNKMDFKQLANNLLQNQSVLLPSWLPGGKLNGREYECGNLSGTAGSSLKVNTETGVWADFATGEKGSDLISLYSAIKNIKQSEAYRELEHYITSRPTLPPVKKPSPPKSIKITKPPSSATPPPFDENTIRYEYRDINGELIYIVNRYEKNGKKQFYPLSWDSISNSWIKKTQPEPRPLYGLWRLKDSTKPILIVEGEKAHDAAHEFAGKTYDVITWSGGTNAHKRHDWSPVYDKNILIWPDADDPGRDAATSIAEHLLMKCKSVKILDVSDFNSGKDAADFPFKSVKDFIEWGKPRARLIELPEPEPAPTPEPVRDIPPPPEPPLELTRAQNTAVEMVQNEMDHSPHKYAKIWDKLGVTWSESTGNPHYNVNNTISILENDKRLSGRVWWDTFHQKYYTTLDNKTPQEWADKYDIKIMRYMQKHLGLIRCSKQMVQDAVLLYAQENPKNEPLDWFKTLKWDATPRVSNFFHEYLGAEQSEYTEAVSRNFWLSMVARIFTPGCKADNMVILEGKQGAFKSTALSIIGGKWYVETNESPNSKDFFQCLQGNLIVEIAELDSFNKAERNTIKKVISTAKDRYRPPYGRTPQDFPRQSIFVGTTNEDAYLNDPTGARRFWPVTINDINTSALKSDREQLFAEAVYLFRQGVKWHEVPKSAKDEQEKRRDSDIWEEIIAEYLESDAARIKGYVTIREIAINCLKFDYDRLTKPVKNRIGAILRGPLECESKPRKMPGSRFSERHFFVEKSGYQLSLNSEHASFSHDVPKRVSVPNYAPNK
jgi:predicted P-loop ATPase